LRRLIKVKGSTRDVLNTKLGKGQVALKRKVVEFLGKAIGIQATSILMR
jgi:hypothetical protein